MNPGDKVTLTKLGLDKGFVGKHGSRDGTVLAVYGTTIKVLRDGYKHPQLFHKHYWEKKKL